MIYITGTNGYIGRNLYARLEHHGLKTAFIDLRGDDLSSVRFARGDCVVHLAGAVHNSVSTLQDFRRINAEMTGGLAQKAAAEGARLIYMSTMAVYGAEDSFNGVNAITRSTPIKPVTPYGISKLEGEHEVERFYGNNVCIIRPPMVYGENCPGNYGLLRKLALRVRLIPRVENSRSMIYVHNLCEFIYLLIKNGDSGVFHPQDAEVYVTHKLARLIGECNGVRVRAVKVPFLSVAGRAVPQIKKAFGSLTYDKELSEYSENYRIYSPEEAVKQTEKLWR